MVGYRARARGPHRPLVGLLTPLAHASSTALTVVAAVLAAALVGASVVLAVLLVIAVRRVARSHAPGRRSPLRERGDEETVPRLPPQGALSWSHRTVRQGTSGPCGVVLPRDHTPVLWDHTGRFCGTNPGARTKVVVPAWSLVSHRKSGLWDHRGPTPLSWARDHAWS